VENTANLSVKGGALPFPVQVPIAAVLVVVESFVSEIITKIACDGWFAYKYDLHSWMTQDTVLVLVTFLVILAGIGVFKAKGLLNEWVIWVASLLVLLLVCLDVWGLRG
jgi:hypothetical protein